MLAIGALGNTPLAAILTSSSVTPPTPPSTKKVGWAWDRKRPIPLELLREILKEQGSPWAKEITDLYQEVQEKKPKSKGHAAALKRVIQILPEYVLQPIDWGPVVSFLDASLTARRTLQAVKNADKALLELERQHLEEDEEESIMLLLH